MLPYNRKLKPRAQNLRKNATPQDIVDFICPSKKLVIEIDGSQHYTDDGLEYDQIRTELLESMGLHVMRFTNTEVDNYFGKVCKTIQDYIDSYKK